MADAVARKARRRFLKLATAGVAAAPFGGMLAMRRARAQDKLSPDDELAQQLGYHEDASQVDANEWPDYVEGHVCAQCQLFKGQAGEEWGPCDIFGGQLVHAKGWCQAWVERQA
jgi:High potential iron-sulfur protein